MVTNISLNDADSARSLAVMLMTLDSTDVLDAHAEMVVEKVVEECYAQEPALDPDDIDDDIEELRTRLHETLSE